MKHYKDRVDKLFLDGILKQGEVSIMNVYHSDDCLEQIESGDCTCDPDVIVETKDGSFSIDSKGEIEKIQ